MKKILFGVVGWNIAETTRMIEVAHIFKDEYECHFFSYGGDFEHLVEEAGYPLHHLSPHEDETKIQHLFKVDRGETFKQPWTLEELRARIQSETELIKKLKPSFAFLGSVLTFSLSCKIEKVKLFNVFPINLSKPYLEAGLPLSPFIPGWLNRLGGWILLNIPLLINNFRKVYKENGFKPPQNALEIWSGDVNIAADVKELSLLRELPQDWFFSGPLFAHLNRVIPQNIVDALVKSQKPKVYFAMGSSANAKILKQTLACFESMDVLVVAPIKSHLSPTDKVPNNVMVTDWLPALQTLELVDVAITHGGQGTVQTTVMAGKPFVGIGMQPEQAINIHTFVKFGNALQIPKNKVSQQRFQKALKEIIENDKYHLKAKEAQTILKSVNTHQIIKDIVKSHLN